MLKDQISGPLAKQACGFLGESEENVSSALGAIFPTILGSLIGKSSKPTEASGLMDMIEGLDMDMIDDIGRLFGGGARGVNGLLNSGSEIVESFLGDKTSGIVSMISKLSGLKSGSSSSLMKLAAPFLMGIIGKQIKGKGLGFLTDMLMGQKEHVAAVLPAGIDDLLGLNFDGLSDSLQNSATSVNETSGAAISDVSDTVNEAVGKAAGTIAAGADATSGAVTNIIGATGNGTQSGLEWIKWALPLLLIGGLAWWLTLGQDSKDVLEEAGNAIENVANKTGDMAKTVEVSVADQAKNIAASTANARSSTGRAASNFAKEAFANENEAGKAALDNISFSANSAGSQMMEFINGGFDGDGKVIFRNLKFASASDRIERASSTEVDNLAAILKAYPDVKINVTEYTDSTLTATTNKALSEDRAKSIKQRLIDAGIAPSRIATQRIGVAKPAVTDDTKEGQAQNRRIEVTIAK